MAHAKSHDYHILPPSPWPFLGGVGVLILAFGAIGLMRYTADRDMILFGVNFAGPGLFVLGLLAIGYIMFAWWRDTVRESLAGEHTPVVQLHLRYGMLLFIVSEVMFFVAWFWAFFDASLLVDSARQVERIEVTGGVWPPLGIETFDPMHLPLLNTLILLTSGTTITWAHHALLENDRRSLIHGLLLTIALALAFTGVQAFEYGHAAFSFSGNIYGATFFMATGFHGFHVIVGTIFLAICLLRVLKGHFTPEKHFAFEAAAWYWHFVDVVWLFLFVSIYVWGA